MSLNLTLKPAQVELVAKPATTIIQAYNIVNNSDTSLILNSEVLPWLPLGTDGSVNYENVPTNPHFEFSLQNSDLKLNTPFIIKPKENKQLVLKIKSDTTTPLNDSYFTFFIFQDQNESPESSNTSTSGRIGSHILVSTSTSETISNPLKISTLKSSPLFTDIFFGKVNLSALASNSNNYFTKTSGKITISKNNLTIKELEIFPQNVASGASRDILCLQNNEPISCTISPPFWPGKYTVSIGNNSTSFFVFPFSLTALILILLGIYFIFKKR